MLLYNKIWIDTSYRQVYFDCPDYRVFWFKYSNKKDLIETLKNFKPNLKANCKTSYENLEKKFEVTK